MKTIQSKAGELILVPVPKEATKFRMGLYNDKVNCHNEAGQRIASIYFKPLGKEYPNAEIIGLSSALSEEQWGQISCSDYGERRRILERIFEMLEDGTLIEDQDCLILLKK